MTNRPYIASAWAYLIGNEIFVGPEKTYVGLGGRTATGPVRSSTIGNLKQSDAAIRSSLACFRADLPISGYQENDIPILAAADIRSFRALVKVAKFVSIVEWADGIEFKASINKGSRYGYELIFPGDRVAHCADLGVALESAFARST